MYRRHEPRCIEQNDASLFPGNLTAELPEFYLAPIPHAVVRSWRGVFMLPDGSYPSEIAYFDESIFAKEHGYAFPLPPTLELRAGDYFLVPNIWWKNYGHWLVDGLSRLFLALPYLPSNVKFIIPAKFDSMRLEGIELLGVKPEQLVVIDSQESWRVERLWYAPPATNAYAHRKGLGHALAQQLMAGLRIQPKKHGRRIFISRREFATRRILNEIEVEACLARYGFETFIPGSLGWRQEVGFFAEAVLVVENTGAGLTNSIFAKPDAILLDLIDPEYFNLYHWSLAESLGMPYWYLLGETVPRAESPLPDLYVPVEKLEQTLARIMPDG